MKNLIIFFIMLGLVVVSCGIITLICYAFAIELSDVMAAIGYVSLGLSCFFVADTLGNNIKKQNK